MLEDVLSNGLQVGDVWDVADIVSHSLDYNIAGWEHKLVGTHLRNNIDFTTDQPLKLQGTISNKPLYRSDHNNILLLFKMLHLAHLSFTHSHVSIPREFYLPDNLPIPKLKLTPN